MKAETKIILASTSPRRQSLLKKIIKEFKIIPSNYKEDMTLKLTPSELAKTLSHGKAAEVAKRQKGIIIGSDTFISLNNKILGKPHTPKKAKEMLESISGKTHEIYTGITIINTETKKEIRDYEITRITFKKLTEEEIEKYIKTKEPLDKAGAYALQGLAKKFIKKIEGSRTSAIGLPLEKLSQMLNKMGVKTK
jgi:septum formation protein